MQRIHLSGWSTNSAADNDPGKVGITKDFQGAIAKVRYGESCWREWAS
jgi:hypothetical protein